MRDGIGMYVRKGSPFAFLEDHRYPYRYPTDTLFVPILILQFWWPCLHFGVLSDIDCF